MQTSILERSDTTQKICDYHYNSKVVGFYDSNREYSNAVVKDFRSTIKQCIKIAPFDESCLELEHNGTTRYRMERDESKRYFKELLNQKRRILIPEETNTVNVELSEEELSIAWKLLQSIPNLFNAIRRHLGGDFVVQEAYHFIAKEYNKKSMVNTSGFWHRDSVGRRIKVFICLETSGYSPITQVLPCTYLDPIPRMWEMVRAEISSKSNNNVRNENMERLKSELQQFRRIEQQYNEGDIVLLDTNAIHRGIYRNEGDDENSYRHLLQISLIARTTLDLQRMVNNICWAQEDVTYTNKLFESIPLHTPPFHKVNS